MESLIKQFSDQVFTTHEDATNEIRRMLNDHEVVKANKVYRTRMVYELVFSKKIEEAAAVCPREMVSTWSCTEAMVNKAVEKDVGCADLVSCPLSWTVSRHDESHGTKYVLEVVLSVEGKEVVQGRMAYCQTKKVLSFELKIPQAYALISLLPEAEFTALYLIDPMDYSDFEHCLCRMEATTKGWNLCFVSENNEWRNNTYKQCMLRALVVRPFTTINDLKERKSLNQQALEIPTECKF